MKRARVLILETPFVALTLDGRRQTAFYAIELQAADGVYIRVANSETREAACEMAQHYVDSDTHVYGSCPDCGGGVAAPMAN